MNRDCHRTRGFTLIELMIVIAIVAILVALAVPAYQDYTIRAKVSECIAAAAPAKTQISEFYQNNVRWPANITEAGLYNDQSTNLSNFCSFYLYNPNRGDYAIDVDVTQISNRVGRILMIMSPEEPVEGNIDWGCFRSWVTADQDAKYLPSSCRGIHTD